MNTTASHSLSRSLVALASAALLAACADAPLAPDRQPATRTDVAALPAAGQDAALATLRRATDRYHDLNVAKNEDYVFLHGCEVRPDEGPVGMVYVHIGRLFDGKIDPAAPDGLIYEPSTNGRPKLVGVELAVPYGLWTGQEPPSFLGAAFQSEDEFGVYGLHVWAWSDNPEGLFAESNPRVSCGIE
jgi:hypothetical protein